MCHEYVGLASFQLIKPYIAALIVFIVVAQLTIQLFEERIAKVQGYKVKYPWYIHYFVPLKNNVVNLSVSQKKNLRLARVGLFVFPYLYLLWVADALFCIW